MSILGFCLRVWFVDPYLPTPTKISQFFFYPKRCTKFSNAWKNDFRFTKFSFWASGTYQYLTRTSWLEFHSGVCGRESSNVGSKEGDLTTIFLIYFFEVVWDVSCSFFFYYYFIFTGGLFTGRLLSGGFSPATSIIRYMFILNNNKNRGWKNKQEYYACLLTHIRNVDKKTLFLALGMGTPLASYATTQLRTLLVTPLHSDAPCWWW